MDKEMFQLFVEEFNSAFDQYLESAQNINNSKKPENELKKLREIVHNLTKSCEILSIDNLRDFFKALETVFSNVKFRSQKRISPLLDKSLGIGFFKFKEIAQKIDSGISLQDIEVLVDVENLYQISSNPNL